MENIEELNLKRCTCTGLNSRVDCPFHKTKKHKVYIPEEEKPKKVWGSSKAYCNFGTKMTAPNSHVLKVITKKRALTKLKNDFIDNKDLIKQVEDTQICPPDYKGTHRKEKEIQKEIQRAYEMRIWQVTWVMLSIAVGLLIGFKIIGDPLI